MSKFDEFFKTHNGKSWDKYGYEFLGSYPQVIEPFAGQCVSLIKTYLIYLYGRNKVKASYGNAIDYWKGRNSNGILELCEVANNPKNGDIIITDADPTFGHIYIYKDDKAFTQNCCANPKATLYPLRINGKIIGVLRPKALIEESKPSKPKPEPIKEGKEGSVYRLYNMNNGDHMYTLDINEANALKTAGWTYEGVAWVSPKEGKPVYRLYHKGQHMFTDDEKEKDNLVKRGWTLEKVAFMSGGSHPIYRMYNKGNGAHVFSADSKEHNALTKAGWSCEGQEMRY